MTRMTRDLPAHTRREPNRDRTNPRVSSAIDAQRRLNARRADRARINADPVGPSDPRYAYLTRAHD
jgi:hypothetical protein